MADDHSPEPNASGSSFGEVTSAIGKFIQGLFKFAGRIIGAAALIGIVVLIARDPDGFEKGLRNILFQEATRLGKESRGEHVDQSTTNHQ